MKTFIRTILLFCVSLTVYPVFAQSFNENELALEYFQKKEYDKAASIYSKLYDRTEAEVYFSYLFECLIQMNDFKTAEKYVKKRLKAFPDDLTTYVYWGDLYEAQHDMEKVADVYDEAIDKIQLDEQQVIKLSDAFVDKKAFEYAKKVYLKGRKLFADYGFYIEMARLYSLQRNYVGMVDEYLNLLEKDDLYLETVQSRLQAQIVYDFEGTIRDLLKQELLKRIQKKADLLVFNELLIWAFIQEKDFENAYYQTMAIDKRNNEDGERVYKLGRLSRSNDAYMVAINCFKYLLDKGKEFGYYSRAKRDLLSTQYNFYLDSENANKDELYQLEQNYKETIGEFGISNETIQMIREYAELLCFYLQKPKSALAILDSALTDKRLQQKDVAITNLLKGDVYVAMDDIWEASLIYARVEKQREHDPIGHEAKFKRARVYYYAGEFEYAKSMLDVLKASTSKLIANDAFELATLINDNTALDTILEPMRIFSRADLLLYQKKDSLAMITFDSIPKKYPGHALEDEIIYKKALIYKNKKNYTLALTYFKEVEERFAYDIYGDDACFHIAEIYDQILNDKDNAMEYYLKIISEHKDSIYISTARSRYRFLKDGI